MRLQCLHLPRTGTVHYTWRQNRRSRHVQLRLASWGGIEMVVPAGFPGRRVPSLLRSRDDWLSQAFVDSGGPGLPALPSRVHLAALAETWWIHYQSGPRARSRTRPLRGVIVHGQGWGQYAALQRWLIRRARAVLPDWLARVSADLGFVYTGVSVRCQRTRWGSCSGRGLINLNAKLLFLPPALVHYVLVHELCHTIYPNHSPAYWQLVADCLPHWRLRDRALRHGERHVPGWMELPVC